MTRETSLYLDVVRFVAALTVFLSHISSRFVTGGLFYQLTNLGVPAVSIFFVLSGYVIAFVTDHRERVPATYAINRMARLYSVAIPALLLTFLLDSIGLRINPDIYGHVTSFSTAEHGIPIQAFAGVGFVNEIWGWNLPIGTNGPYWSLGFEVWYYAAFAAFVFAVPRWKFIAVAACLVFAGPRISAVFPLWLLGVATYRFSQRTLVGAPFGMILFLLGALVLGAGAIWISLFGGPQILAANVRPLTDWQAYAADYLIGIAFAATIVGVNACRQILRPLLPFRNYIRWISGCTFTLYLMHMPIFIFFRAISPWLSGSLENRVLVIVGTFVSILLLAEFTERRKSVWRQTMIHILNYSSPILK